MQVTAMDGADSGLMPRNRIREILYPLFVRRGVHPVDPCNNGWMVHENDTRSSVPVFQFSAEPIPARRAESASVAAGFERIETDDSETLLLDGIIHEFAMVWRAGKRLAKRVTVVVITHERQDRAVDVRQHVSDGIEAAAITMIGQIAGQD